MTICDTWSYRWLLTFLQCSDNNRADTVFSSFITVVEQYGIPDHVRTDHGGENMKYMIAAHNIDFSTVITASSVHNERIERLWRDVNRCVCQQFSFTFKILEDNNRLDPLNEVDIYCLHYLFTPIINKCLLEFKESWNYHCMSRREKRPNTNFIQKLYAIWHWSTILLQV